MGVFLYDRLSCNAGRGPDRNPVFSNSADQTVFEKADRIGGLLRYGIPDFKLEKWMIDQRMEQMRQEGVSFQAGVHVGHDLTSLGISNQAQGQYRSPDRCRTRHPGARDGGGSGWVVRKRGPELA